MSVVCYYNQGGQHCVKIREVDTIANFEKLENSEVICRVRGKNGSIYRVYVYILKYKEINHYVVQNFRRVQQPINKIMPWY